MTLQTSMSRDTKSFIPPIEKHIFRHPSLTSPGIFQSNEIDNVQITPSVSVTSQRSENMAKSHCVSLTKRKVPLSKLVEYPGDPASVASLLASESDPCVDPGGRDMLGYTALHKFASWDKIDLIELLLPHLSYDDVVQTTKDGYSVLHLCVDAGAWRSLKYLLHNCDCRLLDLRDENGNTYLDLARLQGKESFVPSDLI